MLGVGLPALQAMIAEARARSAMMHIRTLFAYARQSAVTSGRTATVCAIGSDGRCSRDWGADHVVTVFFDSNGNRRLDGDERQLRAISWPVENGSITWRASLAATHLSFDNRGATWQNGTLVYCPTSGDARHARALIISQTGRSYTSRDRNGDGIREDRSGRNLQC
jgi:type IV fimbrial biogenesis protein FimT